MATFTPPLRTDWTFAEGAPRRDKDFWAHFGTQPRGRSVLKIDGVWTTVDWPTVSQCNDATPIIDVHGESVPGVFMGGHEHPITETVRLELVAAGYGSYIE